MPSTVVNLCLSIFPVSEINLTTLLYRCQQFFTNIPESFLQTFPKVFGVIFGIFAEAFQVPFHRPCNIAADIHKGQRQPALPFVISTLLRHCSYPTLFYRRCTCFEFYNNSRGPLSTPEIKKEPVNPVFSR